ncbi:MAG: FkbM family methyltransferase [Pseudomonadales bacterium]|nr:FkbM family methyltransferase [Halioglobus sp.]MCP5130728.1 FkbM family methyltransferase [Pseudomonadales bacterium]
MPAAVPDPVALRIPGLSRALSLRVHGDEDRYISRQIRAAGIWEPYETTLVLASLQAGDVFLDVGANIGYYSVLAASRVGVEGAVLAFEPDPGNFRLLAENLQLNDCAGVVTAFEAGLADKTRPGQLYLSEDNAGDHQIFAAAAGRRELPITLYHGADFLRARLSRLDLLKVDVQGAEYAVMSGLIPLLLDLPRLPRIILELTPLSLRQAGSSGRALIELLATLGQPLWIIDHIEHRLAACTREELAQWCDNVDTVEGDMGFMNILAGPAVPGARLGGGDRIHS